MSKRMVVFSLVAFVLLAGAAFSVKQAHAYYCTTTCFGNTCNTWCN